MILTISSGSPYFSRFSKIQFSNKNKNFSYGPNILLLLGMVGNILTEFSLNNSFKYNQITLNQFDLILNKKNVDRKNFKSCTSCGISHEFIDIYELLNKFE